MIYVHTILSTQRNYHYIVISYYRKPLENKKFVHFSRFVYKSYNVNWIYNEIKKDESPHPFPLIHPLL